MISQRRSHVTKTAFRVLAVAALLFSLLSFSTQAYGGQRSLSNGATTGWVDQQLRSAKQANYYQDRSPFSAVELHFFHDALRKDDQTHKIHFLLQQVTFRSIKVNLLKRLPPIHSFKNEEHLSHLLTSVLF